MAANVDEVVDSLKELRDNLQRQLSQVEQMLAAVEKPFSKKSSVSIEDLADKKSFKCEICNRPFETTNALGSHKKAKHGIEGKSRRAALRRKVQERKGGEPGNPLRNTLYEPIQRAKDREQEGGRNETVREGSGMESTKVEQQGGERNER